MQQLLRLGSIVTVFIITETNVSHFDIMASADGKIFTKIGAIDSRAQNGNSAFELSYSFSKVVDNGLMVAGTVMLLSGGLFLSMLRKKQLFLAV